jgi:uncharacterized protein YjbI with pentapeptide repeats
LRGADLENAAVCTDAITINGAHAYDTGELECARFDGADLRAADMRHVRHCVWTAGTQQCRPATAAMLRDAGHADLSGAQSP